MAAVLAGPRLYDPADRRRALLHYALFGEDILAAGPAFLAFLFLLAVAASAFRLMQARQMVRQYRFAYKAAGPFAWRVHGDEEPR